MLFPLHPSRHGLSAVPLCCLALLLSPAAGLIQVSPNMTTFGVAIKAGHCKAGVEITVFEHNISGSNGVITQMWHAGTLGDPRMRV